MLCFEELLHTRIEQTCLHLEARNERAVSAMALVSRDLAIPCSNSQSRRMTQKKTSGNDLISFCGYDNLARNQTMSQPRTHVHTPISEAHNKVEEEVGAFTSSF